MRLAEFQSVVRDFVSDKTMRPRELVLVQAKDEDGFWCNVYEARSVRDGIRFATACYRTEPSDLRVVRGPKREVVKQFSRA